MVDHFLLLRVRRMLPSGWLRPLWYTVGTALDFDQMTAVDGEYTIIASTLIGKTIDKAISEVPNALLCLAPLIGNAKPEAWLADQLGLPETIKRVEAPTNYDGAPSPLVIVPGIPETQHGGAIGEAFERARATFKPADESPDPWGHYDFSKTSLAVVASDGHGNGCVLHHVGGHIAFDLSEVGRGLGDIGLDNAPEGISVWEGRHTGSGEDVTLEGEFRDPTDAEAAAIARGECPWDEDEWLLPVEPCKHPAPRTVQHSSEKHDRIDWCPCCGALRLCYGSFEWELPDREATRG